MGERPFMIVPILVGALKPEREQEYGKLLAPYLADPSTVFVVSSDFCHWGKRFRYTYTDPGPGDIGDAIERLDKKVGRIAVG
jgi:MEMO1 family protein